MQYICASVYLLTQIFSDSTYLTVTDSVTEKQKKLNFYSKTVFILELYIVTHIESFYTVKNVDIYSNCFLNNDYNILFIFEDINNMTRHVKCTFITV